MALLSTDGRIFNVDTKANQCAPFRKVDGIKKISGGASAFVELWEEAEVAEFFTSIGFDETENIIMHSKIKGSMLTPFDEDFVANTLGLVGATEQQKIRYELSRCTTQRIVEQSVIGWGANSFSQLGLS